MARDTRFAYLRPLGRGPFLDPGDKPVQELVDDSRVLLPFQTMSPEVDDLRVDPRDAARRVAAGEAFLLDVVTEGSWRSLPRVPKGALRIPPEDLIARLDEIPRDRAAIAFCT